jgi:CheY-like chemotaxis protein
MNANVSGGAAARPRWMLVDDDPQFLKVMRLSLATFRHIELCCCLGGGEALDLFAAAPRMHQIVITDLIMPGMSGLELSSRLRALSPGVRIILITGDSAAISESEARQLGFAALLYKPFTVGALRSAISEAINSVAVCD